VENNQQFNDAYWLHQPPEVRVLRGIPEQESAQLVQELATKYSIDVPIMVWGWDPYKTMIYRQGYGYKWVPAFGQPPVSVAPGLTFPNDQGLQPYDPDNPPAGSIKVSTDIADYSPFDGVVAPPTKPSSHVGQDTGFGYFNQIDPDTDPSKDGDLVTEPRGTFKFRKGIVGGWYIKVG
jgi:hypothetical protein